MEFKGNKKQLNEKAIVAGIANSSSLFSNLEKMEKPGNEIVILKKSDGKKSSARITFEEA